ncbi:alpha-tubulin [Naegleria gruberi]|uniref:Alpha-tubulin n=1 Tax=Naegleria gruberi TaxID=5762 RepID=D2VS63_NAEGR|nr:alpha-tubulin [Naegleria gruberi]EFC40371.1 alpha-tubulin [Naegleria gruberi]|eukprot:XP_002673115.1 alpha-tubulin [Naegleria gruberi]
MSVICIQVGGAGNRIGLSAWEQLLREHEHCIFPDKFTEEEKRRRFNSDYQNDQDKDEKYLNVFREKEDGKFVPRTLFIDLERPILTISELSDSTGENLLKLIQDHESECSESNSLFVSETSSVLDSSSYTYANGRHSSRSKKLLEIAMERIRSLVEKCESPFSFMIVSSIGGGLGSGFVSLLMDSIYTSYSKTYKCAISISPDFENAGDNGPIEALNSFLYMGNSTNGWDAKIFMENKAIENLCKKEFHYSSMDSVNELISLVISNVTACNRFEGPLSTDLQNLTHNFPYPVMNILYPSFGPIHSSMKTVPHGYGTEMFTYDCLASPFIESSEGYTMCSSLLYRGYVEPRTINTVVRKLKDERALKFCSWNPSGLKVGAVFHRPLYSCNSNLLNMHITAFMLSNSTRLKSSLERIKHGANEILTMKSLLHHFHSEGMELDEITELTENFESLVEGYQELNAEEELGPDEE